ncbi:MAG: magnesium transporter [Demequinaceae bacterium]|nr:magnesium transporter [Demequinaceae bacterium]
MSTQGERVYVARLVGTTVFDPLGDPVGRVRDVVLLFRAKGAPTAVGFVIEVGGRRRVFLPLTRVTSIAAGQIICTGLVNLRRFHARATEKLAVAEVLEQCVTMKDGSGDALIEDLAIERTRTRVWTVTLLSVRLHNPRKGPLGLRRRAPAVVVSLDDIEGLGEREEIQGAELVLQSFADYKPAELAAVLQEMTPERGAEIAAALDDERLADVLEELPEDDQVAMLSTLRRERAADVLEAMEPDDAADLLGDLPKREAEKLLKLMEPEATRNVRQLLEYADDVAGGLMTTEPVIVGPEATVATALALVRDEKVTPSLASMVFVVRPPLETPTGRYLGLVHIQRLLREAPRDPIGGFVDPTIPPLAATDHLSEVSRRMATYDLVAAPVVDEDGRLLGVISADDVLDHLLPEDWRGSDDGATRAVKARG